MPFPRLGAPCVAPAVLIAPTPLPAVPRAAPLLVELAAEFGEQGKVDLERYEDPGDL